MIPLGAILGPDAAQKAMDAMGRALDAATTLHGTIQENDVNHEQITEVSTTVDAGLEADDLAHLSEAERLGLIVGAAYGRALAERDEARAALEATAARLAEASDLLAKATEFLEPSSWAVEEDMARSIQAFLASAPVDSTETPTQED